MSTSRPPPLHPPGEGKTLWRATLEAGADILQDTAPLKGFDIYVAGLHCARHQPARQMEAHHYCRQVNSEVLHCVLFDGNTADANLIGVEYIISERLFGSLPDEEKDFWHPHNYEILSGQLTAPGLPEVAEHALMALLVNSYGKTWHTWHTGTHLPGGAGDALPLGEAALMWSFNRDGEADERLKADLNAALGVDEAAKRRHRHDLARHARPQRGVNVLRHAFPAAGPPPDGVRDQDDDR